MDDKNPRRLEGAGDFLIDLYLAVIS